MSVRPWYREPWPWLLMAGPATVLVAGAATTWIAFASADGLVAEDYYKQLHRRLLPVLGHRRQLELAHSLSGAKTCEPLAC